MLHKTLSVALLLRGNGGVWIIYSESGSLIGRNICAEAEGHGYVDDKHHDNNFSPHLQSSRP